MQYVNDCLRQIARECDPAMHAYAYALVSIPEGVDWHGWPAFWTTSAPWHDAAGGNYLLRVYSHPPNTPDPSDAVAAYVRSDRRAFYVAVMRADVACDIVDDPRIGPAARMMARRGDLALVYFYANAGVCRECVCRMIGRATYAEANRSASLSVLAVVTIQLVANWAWRRTKHAFEWAVQACRTAFVSATVIR